MRMTITHVSLALAILATTGDAFGERHRNSENNHFDMTFSFIAHVSSARPNVA